MLVIDWAAMSPNMQPCLSQQTKEIQGMVFCRRRQKEQSFPGFPFLPSPMADILGAASSWSLFPACFK